MKIDPVTHFLCEQLCTDIVKVENPNGTPVFMYDLGQKNHSSFLYTANQMKASRDPALSGWLKKGSAIWDKTCRMLCVSLIQDKTKADGNNVCPPEKDDVKCCYKWPKDKSGPAGLTSRTCPAGTVAGLRAAIDKATKGISSQFFFYPDGTVKYNSGGDMYTIPTTLPQGAPKTTDDDNAADWGRLQTANTAYNSNSLSQCESNMIIPNYTLGYLLFDEGRALNLVGKDGDRILVLYNPVHRNAMIDYLTNTLGKKSEDCAKVLSSYAAAVVTSTPTPTVNGTNTVFGDPMGNILWQLNTVGSNAGKAELRSDHQHLIGNAVTGQNSALWNKLDLEPLMSKIGNHGKAYCIAPAARWVTPSSNTIQSNPYWLPGVSYSPGRILTSPEWLHGAPGDLNNTTETAPTAIFWWLWNQVSNPVWTVCSGEHNAALCQLIYENRGSIPVASLSHFCQGKGGGGGGGPNTTRTVAIIIGIILGVVALVALGVGGWYYYKKKYKK